MSMFDPVNQGYDRDNNTSSSSSERAASRPDPFSPTNTYATLNREWWDDQQARYQPLQDMANNMLLDPGTRQGLRNEGLNAVTKDVHRSYNRAEDRMNTLRSRTNQQQSARSIRSNSRVSSLERATTAVSARNAARDFMDESEMELIRG